MSVSEQIPFTSYTGNGVTTVFDFPWYCGQANDLVVMLDGAAITTGFTSTGFGSDSGGSVTFGAAPASGARVVLYRDTGLARQTNYQVGGDLLAGVVNADVDRIWQALQDFAAGAVSIANTIRVPPGESVLAAPAKAVRALQLAAYDSAGNPTVMAIPSGEIGDASNTLWLSRFVGAVGRRVDTKLDDLPSVKDWGAPTDGSTIVTSYQNAAISATGLAFFPPGNKWTTDLGLGVGQIQGMSFHSDESFDGQGTISVTRKTSTNRDAIKAEHYGAGTGYALHAISYATTGGGVGGATWGTGAGVTGNKRGSTLGNGVYGAAGIDNGANQTGVSGLYTGTAGGGTGVAGVNESTANTGTAGFFWRKNGAGQAIEALRDGSTDGKAGSFVRSGSGAGDALGVEHSSSGGGAAVTAVKKSGATTYSIGYLGFFDGTQSIGVYGYAAAGGTTRWAGRFDGDIYVTGVATLGGGAKPLTDGDANMGAAGRRFNTYYGVVGAINTSDANQKQDIQALTTAEQAVAASLKALVKSFRFRDAVAAKGAEARTHVGWIAQDVEAAFSAQGLDASKYAMWCQDELPDGTLRQGLRMDQVLAFVVSAI